MAGMLRAVAMSVASSAQLTVDRVEDTGLAMNEAFRTVVDHAPADTDISCVFESGGGQVQVAIGTQLDGDAVLALDSLGEMILSGITDELELPADADGLRFVVANRE